MSWQPLSFINILESYFEPNSVFLSRFLTISLFLQDATDGVFLAFPPFNSSRSFTKLLLAFMTTAAESSLPQPLSTPIITAHTMARVPDGKNLSLQLEFSDFLPCECVVCFFMKGKSLVAFPSLVAGTKSHHRNNVLRRVIRETPLGNTVLSNYSKTKYTDVSGPLLL